jgi:SAM-dependent methyltransferase
MAGRVVGRVRRRGLHTKRLVVSALRPYAPLQGGADVLEAEYREGVWDHIVGEREVPRFNVVAGYCQRTAVRPRVLEIGCGEGLLADQLTPQRYARYVGVDVSTAATERARARTLPDACFVVADAAVFKPDDVFDTIVFNEVLEYFPNPVELVRRYERWLAPSGEFVVSQYLATDDARTRRIWWRLHRRYTPRMSTHIRTAGLTWQVEAFAPCS